MARLAALISAALAGVLFSLAPTASGALPQAPGAVDLLTGTDIRIDGAATDDMASYSVTGAGDVNGDGLDDVIVGSPFSDNNGRADSGSAYLVFGRRTPTTIDAAALGGSGFRIDGEAADDNAGRSVGRVGDVNGDGLDDVIVGRGDPNDAERGYAHVVFGKRSNDPIDLAALGGGGFRIDGTTGTTERAGLKVAGGQDVNGDGRDDIVVAAPFAGNNGRNDSGSLHVIFGRPGGGAVDLGALGAGGFRIDGSADNEFLGNSGVALGDVDGDRRADVIAAEPGADNNGRLGSGSTYVVFGAASSAPVDVTALGSRGFRIDGAGPGDGSGASLGVVPDMTGDGRSEVVTGAFRADNNGRADSGSAYVVLGGGAGAPVDLASLGARGARIDGPVVDSLMGGAVGGADVNGDGRGEAIADAPLNRANNRDASGSAFVLLAGPGGRIVDAASFGAAGYQLDGPEMGYTLGGPFGSGQVSGAGDVNGDGREEVVVASVEADNNGRVQSGSAYVVFGPPPLPGSCANPRFGTSLPDRLGGTGAGDRLRGLAASDEISGGRGRDCLHGGAGNDGLAGGPGDDRLTGDGGTDRFSGGSGNDRINARDGRRERVNCGGGRRDRATVDRRDRVARNCERVSRR